MLRSRKFSESCFCSVSMRPRSSCNSSCGLGFCLEAEWTGPSRHAIARIAASIAFQPCHRQEARPDCFSLIAMSAASFGLALAGHGRHRPGNLRLIAQVVVLQWFEVVIQFIDEWDAGGDVHADNILVADLIQILHQRTQ